jgi:hypothetical protein
MILSAGLVDALAFTSVIGGFLPAVEYTRFSDYTNTMTSGTAITDKTRSDMNAFQR